MHCSHDHAAGVDFRPRGRVLIELGRNSFAKRAIDICIPTRTLK